MDDLSGQLDAVPLPEKHFSGQNEIAAQRVRKLNSVEGPRAQPLTSNCRAPVEDVSRSNISPAINHSDVGARRTYEIRLEASPNIAVIVQLWRQRQAWHRAEKILVLQAQARCRAFTNGDKDEAQKLWQKAEKGQDVDPILAINLAPFLASIPVFQEKRVAVEETLAKLARETKYWPLFGKEVRGFGANSLAAIIGEAGEISSYRNPSCFWKRMGLAVIDGERQRKCTDKAKAELHGYNPRRRAVMYVISTNLLRSKSQYREVYDQRKQEKTAAGWTKKHAHDDALRFMAKRLLRDLWIATQPVQ